MQLGSSCPLIRKFEMRNNWYLRHSGWGACDAGIPDDADWGPQSCTSDRDVLMLQWFFSVENGSIPATAGVW